MAFQLQLKTVNLSLDRRIQIFRFDRLLVATHTMIAGTLSHDAIWQTSEVVDARTPNNNNHVKGDSDRIHSRLPTD